ncbi:MAG TPA: serine/threonine-protein kinase [Thermoleophilaceae bacterium]|nr:serine/threonine-protein kinase [Thermoleophilaceae bacterium]
MTAAPPLPRGAAIAPGYEVIEHLRRGNALDVYDVWSEQRACRCIVKALRPDRGDDAGARRRLIEEGGLLAALSHPHIVRGYETIAEPLPLVVMETLVGETLGHMVRERQVELTVEEIAQLGLHLASAVRYLHLNGYLHLDLKPSNVIAECGRAKLIDLSVARPPGRAHAGIGTWCYMAPEQVRGGELGPAADVWGIGAVLLEAATGEPAFDEPEASSRSGYAEDDASGWVSTDGGSSSASSGELESLDAADHPQIRARAPRLDERRPLSAALSDLVAACLEPEPGDRPSVRDLLAALEPLAGVPAAERRHAAIAGQDASARRR